MPVEKSQPQPQDRAGNFSQLWRRAPAFRRMVYAAASVSLVAVIALAIDREIVETLSLSDAPKTIALAAPSVSSASSVRAELVQKPEAAAAPAAAPSAPKAEFAASLPLAEEEDKERARCHPHLIPGSAAMPQIDVSQMADPSLGHLKVHFWVNGAGLVTREVLTATSYATSAERQAELEFTKGLTFTVPNTAQCRSREMELIGDFFEMRNPAGQWATYVRLYPRLSFDTEGVIRSRD